VGAWKQSQSSGAPFSKIIIGDNDRTRLDAAEARLKALGAPVQALYGTAAQNALPAIQKSTGNGLNFAFLDPYNLASLDFSILSTLAKLRRIDILVHVSQMDLQRNFDRNAVQDVSALDIFAPGWRTGANTERAQKSARQAYFQYWRDKVSGLGINAATDTRLVTGPGNQPLYLLLLAAKHDLAHRFWQTVAKKDDGQGSLRL
jgi:three-Cys-motif partner protein